MILSIKKKTKNDTGIVPGTNPIQIDCGVYVNSFGSFDYNKNTYFINFHIWWLMDENIEYFPENKLEITNAHYWTKLWTARDRVDNKIRAQARIYATIPQNWDMKYFPFDRQKIRISLEDSKVSIEKVKYNALSEMSMMSPDIDMSGWKVRFDLIHQPHQAQSNFGNTDLKKIINSRIDLIFVIKREGWKIFFIYFIGYFSAIFLSCISFLIPRHYFKESTTLCVGAIFAAITNKTQLEFSLSASSGLSFSGIFTLCTFFFIILTIINTILTNYLHNRGKKSLSNWINNSIFFTLVLSTLIVMGTALMEAVNS